MITFSEHLASKSRKEVTLFNPWKCSRLFQGGSTFMCQSTLEIMDPRKFFSSKHWCWRTCARLLLDIIRFHNCKSTLAHVFFAYTAIFHPTFLSDNIIQASHTHPTLPPSFLAISGGECFETWSLLWHLVQQSQPLQARVHRDVERTWRDRVGRIFHGVRRSLIAVSRICWVIGDLTWPSTNIWLTTYIKSLKHEMVVGEKENALRCSKVVRYFFQNGTVQCWSGTVFLGYLNILNDQWRHVAMFHLHT